MKSFACGTVVPGCAHTFTAADDDDLLARISEHAADHHGLPALTPALVADVRSKMTTVS